MIGYYVHHVGRGHLHHALAVAPHLDDQVVALSSLPREDTWPGDWVGLPRDDAGAHHLDPTAGGALHWAPVRHVGLQDRMAAIAAWIAANRPCAMVVDVSVEVGILARLMGVPVVTFALPGVRDDAPHRLGWDLADAIIAPWPAECRGLGASLRAFGDRTVFTGAISRFAPRTPSVPSNGNRVLVLGGAGGDGSVVLPELPGRTVTTLGPANWTPDPWAALCAADVVVTHCGLGALADVAAARKPAVVVPQRRPFDEQFATAAQLAEHRLAVVAQETPVSAADWDTVLDEAVRIGGARWEFWYPGDGARRAAAVVESVARSCSPAA